MKDEGIVQPVSKEMEQLSRRLHQFVRASWRNPCCPRRLAILVSAMARQLHLERMSSESAAYIAGLIDGEGTVTLTRLHANENRRLVVSIASTELQLLVFAREQIGAGKITRKTPSCERHSPSWCFCITSRQALALLRRIAPHLRSYKHERAKLILQDYIALTPRNGRYTPDVLARRRLFERRLLELRANGTSTPLLRRMR